MRSVSAPAILRMESNMAPEIESLVAKTTNREALARLFDRIAETIGAPLEFKCGDDPTEEEQETIEEVGEDG